jgi:hypothetical protein
MYKLLFLLLIISLSSCKNWHIEKFCKDHHNPDICYKYYETLSYYYDKDRYSCKKRARTINIDRIDEGIAFVEEPYTMEEIDLYQKKIDRCMSIKGWHNPRDYIGENKDYQLNGNSITRITRKWKD